MNRWTFLVLILCSVVFGGWKKDSISDEQIASLLGTSTCVLNNQTPLFFSGILHGESNEFIEELWQFHASNLTYSPLWKSQSNIRGRAWSSSACSDQKIFIFGGVGPTGGLHNDLWEFDVLTRNWTMLSSSTGPGVRLQAALNLENKTSLLLFGGYGMSSNGSRGVLGDVWRFNLVSKTWIFVTGATTVNDPPVYSATNGSMNFPGSRYGMGSWIRDSTLYLLGGSRDWIKGDSSEMSVSSLWILNLNTLVWNRLGGSDTDGDDGRYNTTDEYPGARSLMTIAEKPDGNVIVFGGSKSRSQVLSFTDLKIIWSDMWEYNANNNSWKWLGGDSAPLDQTYEDISDNGTFMNGTWPYYRFSGVGWIHDNVFHLMHGFSELKRDLSSYRPLPYLWSYNFSSQPQSQLAPIIII